MCEKVLVLQNSGGKAHGFNRGMKAGFLFFFFYQKRLFRKNIFLKIRHINYKNNEFLYFFEHIKFV